MKYAVKKHLIRLFKTGSLLLAASLCLVGCNKDKNPSTVQPSEDLGGSQIEDVQTTVKKLALDYIEDNQLENAIQNKNDKRLKEIVSQKIGNIERDSFTTAVKNGRAVAIYKHENQNGKAQLGSMLFDLSANMQYYLGTDLADILVYEIGELGNATTSTSNRQKYEEKFDLAMDKVLNNINTDGYSITRANEYVADCGISTDLKEEVLKYIESRSTNKLVEPVVFGAPREDGSALLVGVDEQGRLWEYCFNVTNGENMTPSAYYGQVGAGALSGITSRELDASRAYDKPAVDVPQKDMVAVSELYEAAFKGFQFADLGGLMNDLAKRELSGWTANVLFAEFDNTKTEITLYAEGVDSRNRTSLLKLSFKSDFGDIVKNIWDYQEFKNMTDEEIKQYVLDALNITETEVEKDSADQTEIEGDLAKERQRLESLGNDIQDDSKLKLVNREIMINATETELANVNQYGEKLLEDEKNIEILRTYLGAWKGKNFDTQNRFGTGYLEWGDACVVYTQNGKIKIYNTEVAVPWYVDTTAESKYQSILDGVYSLRNEQTAEIQNSILFAEKSAKASSETYNIEIPVDLFFEDRR